MSDSYKKAKREALEKRWSLGTTDHFYGKAYFPEGFDAGYARAVARLRERSRGSYDVIWLADLLELEAKS